MRPIALSGFMGAGKSTVGQRLARAAGRTFVDLDREVEAAFGVPIQTVFATHGEAAFRAMEARLLRQALSRPDRVVALGGGAPLDPSSRAYLRSEACWIHLDVPAPELKRRIAAAAGGHDRPLWDELRIEQMLAERAPAYEEATFRVDGDRPPAEVSAAVEAVASSASGLTTTGPMDPADGELHRLRVEVPGSEYDVVVGRGLDETIEAEAGYVGDGPIALLTDWNVGPLHAARVHGALTRTGREVVDITLPAGEDRKDARPVMDAVDKLLVRGWQRSSPIVALGGGVLGDMAGLAAALTLRGVPLVQLPTTLLAMVDSSVGGKVGVNHRAGKNLIGAFKQPALVIADLRFLDTLPDRELRSGLAEALKTGLLGDVGLVELMESRADELLARDPELLSDVVVRCARVKAHVVAQDEREAGLRRILNYGHTIGHALEVTLGYGTLLHGEAIAIGMVAAAELAVDLGIGEVAFPARLRTILQGLGLPTSAPPVSRRALAKAAAMDKKLKGTDLAWVLLASPGNPVVVDLPTSKLDVQLAYLLRLGVFSESGV
ncbi:MAG: 3-dehydroquinate synthase [Proteobacteria bacterium]|nr:3-dehydroquinate synthase [Pseudomonadota bacterium]